jgi:hypothetical protein
LFKDGNWSGVMGLLQRREIDFCLVGNTITSERAQVPTIKAHCGLFLPILCINFKTMLAKIVVSQLK